MSSTETPARSNDSGIAISNGTGLTLGDLLYEMRRQWYWLVLAPLAAGALALAITYAITPTFTATATFMPPQQASQSGTAAALASLGSLGSIGGLSPAATPADRYVGLMQSETVSDRIVEHFKLRDAYKVELRSDARQVLAKKVNISVGKKDGLISVSVDDSVPQRAADIANRYIDELRRMTANLAVTEAQQRRVFFERQLQQTRDRLTAAQQSLQSSGFTASALRTEPRAAAENYARLKAEVTASEVRLQTLRSAMADDTPEVRSLQSQLAALRTQLSKVEQTSDTPGTADYVSKYREFKYQETLFDLYARQFELARADESREGALIQVVDAAQLPERKSKPKRATVAMATTGVALLLAFGFIWVRASLRVPPEPLAQ